jgi:hypothetical protein
MPYADEGIILNAGFIKTPTLEEVLLASIEQDNPLEHFVRIDAYRFRDYMPLLVHRYKITRCTKASVFVDDYGYERRIGRDWLKQYAHPTTMQAFNSLVARRQRQKLILSTQLEDATTIVDELLKVKDKLHAN